jgi:hypothetical protein
MDERISYDNVSMLSESKRKLLEDYVKEKGETLINVLGSRYLKRGLAGKRTRMSFTVLLIT